MGEDIVMKQDDEGMKRAVDEAKKALVERRAKGESIADEADFISREIQQFFMDRADDRRDG